MDRRNRAIWLIARLAWALMLIAHAEWLWHAALAGTASRSSFVGLLAASVFFGLKAVDVPFLRVRTDRRALIAMALVVVLLHSGPIQRSLGMESDLMWWWLPLAAAVSACPAFYFARLVRRVVESLAWVVSALQAVLYRAYRRAYAGFVDVLDHRLRHFSITLATPRAPPA